MFTAFLYFKYSIYLPIFGILLIISTHTYVIIKLITVAIITISGRKEVNSGINLNITSLIIICTR